MTVLWLRTVGVLAVVSVCLPSGFRSSVSAQRLYGRSPQVNRVVSYPGSTSYSFNEYSSEFQTFSNSYPSMTYNYNGSNQYSGGNALPTFQFLSNSGITITVPGPYPESDNYHVKFYININRDFYGVKRGHYEGDADPPVGVTWIYTFPNIQLKQSDIIYYWVVATGSLGSRQWFREYKGYYTVPQVNPHGKPGSSYMPQSSPPYPPQSRPTYQQPKPQTPPYQPQPKPQSPPSYQPQPYPPYQQKPQKLPTYQPPTYQPPASPQIPSYQPQPIPKPQRPLYRPQIEPKPQQPSRPFQPQQTPQTITGSVDLSEYGDSKPYPDKSQTCSQPSLTVINNGKPVCPGQSFVNSFKFEAVEQIAGYEPEETFTVFMKQNLIKNATVTAFLPQLLEDVYGANHVDDSLSLSDCTSQIAELCSSAGTGYLILPPIIAARETTEKDFSFRYGILEVTAKFPRGDWIVPELWLLPKNRVYGNNSGRIVLGLSRGNSRLTDAQRDLSSRTLEVGVEYGAKKHMYPKSRNTPWHDGFHKFKLVWTPDLMQFLVDDEEIGTVQARESALAPYLRGSNMAPFDQEFYLSFGVHVGGDKDFPDVSEKPWKNYEPKKRLKFWRDKGTWLRTWFSEHTPMYISKISLTALDQ